MAVTRKKHFNPLDEKKNSKGKSKDKKVIHRPFVKPEKFYRKDFDYYTGIYGKKEEKEKSKLEHAISRAIAESKGQEYTGEETDYEKFLRKQKIQDKKLAKVLQKIYDEDEEEYNEKELENLKEAARYNLQQKTEKQKMKEADGTVKDIEEEEDTELPPSYEEDQERIYLQNVLDEALKQKINEKLSNIHIPEKQFDEPFGETEERASNVPRDIKTLSLLNLKEKTDKNSSFGDSIIPVQENNFLNELLEDLKSMPYDAKNSLKMNLIRGFFSDHKDISDYDSLIDAINEEHDNPETKKRANILGEAVIQNRLYDKYSHRNYYDMETYDYDDDTYDTNVSDLPRKFAKIPKELVPLIAPILSEASYNKQNAFIRELIYKNKYNDFFDNQVQKGIMRAEDVEPAHVAIERINTPYEDYVEKLEEHNMGAHLVQNFLSDNSHIKDYETLVKELQRELQDPELKERSAAVSREIFNNRWYSAFPKKHEKDIYSFASTTDDEVESLQPDDEIHEEENIVPVHDIKFSQDNEDTITLPASVIDQLIAYVKSDKTHLPKDFNVSEFENLPANKAEPTQLTSMKSKIAYLKSLGYDQYDKLKKSGQERGNIKIPLNLFTKLNQYVEANKPHPIKLASIKEKQQYLKEHGYKGHTKLKTHKVLDVELDKILHGEGLKCCGMYHNHKDLKRHFLSRKYHNLNGSGLFDKIKQFGKSVVNRISNVIHNNQSPNTEKALAKFSDWYIEKAFIYRTPVEQKFVLNALTLSKFEENIIKNGYDNVFHLACVFEMKSPNGEIKYLLTEKKPNIMWDVKKVSDPIHNAQGLTWDFSPVNFRSVVDLTKKTMGNDFQKYNPINNNCQRWILTLLQSIAEINNDKVPEEATNFIYQDVNLLFKNITGAKQLKSLTTGITSLGHFFGRIIGNGIRDNRRLKHITY